MSEAVSQNLCYEAELRNERKVFSGPALGFSLEVDYRGVLSGHIISWELGLFSGSENQHGLSTWISD
ncbi:MAG: hypothetical protein B6245_12520 [Desulfobacteraceae bacterium 4572_88]|nr:MAG: hypothetical protein B6245_12520 [Desulfobacteraceae bacterium 4572_88]